MQTKKGDALFVAASNVAYRPKLL